MFCSTSIGSYLGRLQSSLAPESRLNLELRIYLLGIEVRKSPDYSYLLGFRFSEKSEDLWIKAMKSELPGEPDLKKRIRVSSG